MIGPLSFFSEVEDPRIDRTKAHDLQHIIAIALMAVICGCETWEEIEEFGEMAEEWLTKTLYLINGIPSHDTFNRVLSRIDPLQMEKSFLKWTQNVVQLTAGEVVAFDGKTIRGSTEKGKKPFVHMVSAWAGLHNMVLGQVKVDDKSNEITAIPQLLQLLVLKGCIVTIDAMGCQKEIAAAIIDKGADYVLALKGNQTGLHEQVKESFATFKSEAVSQTLDCDHGRIETRTCSVLTDFWMIENKNSWKNLNTLVRLDSVRIIKATGVEQRETRYYITSLLPDPKKIAHAVRSHWGIENSLHWCLDVGFSEDASQKSAGHAARNFSLLNRIALNLIKANPHKRLGIKSRRKKAGWDRNYLLKLLKDSRVIG